MKYNVNWNLDTGDKQYKAGDSVDLEKEVAEPLLASGVLSKPPAKKPVSETPASPSSDDPGTSGAPQTNPQ